MASISDANVTSVTATDGRYVIFTDVTNSLQALVKQSIFCGISLVQFRRNGTATEGFKCIFVHDCVLEC